MGKTIIYCVVDFFIGFYDYLCTIFMSRVTEDTSMCFRTKKSLLHIMKIWKIHNNYFIYTKVQYIIFKTKLTTSNKRYNITQQDIKIVTKSCTTTSLKCVHTYFYTLTTLFPSCCYLKWSISFDKNQFKCKNKNWKHVMKIQYSLWPAVSHTRTLPHSFTIYTYNIF